MRAAPIAALVAAALAGCGSGSAQRPADAGSRAARPAPRPLPADAATMRVVRRWADTLRRGDVEGAARLFAIPSIAQNNTPVLHLDSRVETLAFNLALPCGARVLRGERRGRYTVVTFRLTRRPGASCGPGVGGTARTGFIVRGGRIRQWIRVPGDGGGPVPVPPPPTAPRTLTAPLV
jgi:hypothetical protein